MEIIQKTGNADHSKC